MLTNAMLLEVIRDEKVIGPAWQSVVVGGASVRTHAPIRVMAAKPRNIPVSYASQQEYAHVGVLYVPLKGLDGDADRLRRGDTLVVAFDEPAWQKLIDRSRVYVADYVFEHRSRLASLDHLEVNLRDPKATTRSTQFEGVAR